MANLSVVKRAYESFLRKLFPQGWAWNQEPDSVFGKLLEATAWEPARIELRGFDFLREMHPLETFEMLDNWERLLKIPDECTPDSYDPSLFERRVRVLQKLTTGGGQTIQFYKLIAAQLGYDISVLDVENFKPFQAGISEAGDALTNSVDANGDPTAAGWAYAFLIVAPAEFVRYFQAGQGVAGDPLVYASNETLECIIRKFAPAHTTPIFSFTD